MGIMHKPIADGVGVGRVADVVVPVWYWYAGWVDEVRAYCEATHRPKAA
jgi:hypothetical protein